MTSFMLQPTINPFNFQSHEVRTVTISEKVWFCAKDIYLALGLTWSGLKSSSLKNVPEKWVIPLQHQTTKGERDLVFISEPAVYQAIFRSNSPQSIAFTEWVCEEVLPEIRRNGFYGEIDLKEKRMLRDQLIKIAGLIQQAKKQFMHEILWDQFNDVCRQLGQKVPEQSLIEQQRSLPGI